MKKYQLYGLCIASDFEIDKAAGSECPADITITKEDVILPELKRSPTGALYAMSDATIFLSMEGVGDFRIHAGKTISAEPHPGVRNEVFQRVLSGAILAMALYQRGRLVFHASAITFNGGAVLFAGDSGYGKSTLAANLHANGYQLLADDIVAVEQIDNVNMVFPGVQEFKLYPDSVRTLGKDEEKLDRLYANGNKRLLSISEGSACDQVPLKLIYILDFDENENISLLKPAQATIELVRNTYAVRALHEVRTEWFFRQIVQVAESVPVLHLKRRSSLDSFDGFLTMVRQDIKARLGVEGERK